MLTQKRINILNFSVAILAFLVSLPAAVNELNKIQTRFSEPVQTEIVNYSPPAADSFVSDFSNGELCWGSLLSGRSDAYRCATDENFLYDPCFIIENIGAEVETLYCPNNIEDSKEDVVIKVASENIERRFITIGEEQETDNSNNKDLPWLVVLDNDKNIICRLRSGAVGRAYGDLGNYYGCNDGNLESVTGGVYEDTTFFLECKEIGRPYFSKCSAKTAVF
ncbi:TPA: hypothetical protein EYO12_02685 [Candidatus Saccharibacteria bacterium]|nr:hypothetical protein [Candidatus Saccharibacteria bacterium]HIO88054.1 hypothetical protein [Candidatus Saccharibacteria bacterium]